MPDIERSLMRNRKPLLFALFLAVLASVLALGCGGDGQPDSDRARFRSLRKGSVELYLELHPLRASRIGMTGSDSLLFTFSPGELSIQLGRIDSLLAIFNSLPAAHLGETEIEESSLIVYWLSGESAALGKLKNHERSPALYCWMIEEALFGIPSRGGKPGEREFIDYCKRIEKIPDLIRNAESHLRNPAELHLIRAIDRLSSINERFPVLEGTLMKRYGTVPSSIQQIGESIAAFRAHLWDEVLPHAHGRHIMGVEDLSDLLKYSEHLDIDLDRFITDAETTSNQQKSQINAIIKNPEYASGPAGADIYPLLAEIDDLVAGGGLSNPDKRHIPEIIISAPPELPEDLPVNPYLAIPEYAPGRATWAACSPEEDGPPSISIRIDPKLEDLGYARIFFEMIDASSPVVDTRYAICSGPPIRRIFASRLYILAWNALNKKDISTLDEVSKLSLRKIYLERMNLELARMIVALKLHSGRSTIDLSIDFLVSELGMTREEAEFEVAEASVSPSRGFYGIALTETANMTREAAAAKRQKDPHKRIRKMIREEPGTPLPLIMKKIRD